MCVGFLSVCLFVVHACKPCKTDEPVEMLFGMWTREAKAELSMGWVDPWIWLGWVELGRVGSRFSVFGGWVHYSLSE